MRNLKPPPVRSNPQRKVYINKDLFSGTHVFVRNDRVRKPLQHPYNGPYRILDRAKKYFTLDCARTRCRWTVSNQIDVTPEDTDFSSLSQPTSPTPLSEPTCTTRTGKRVHFPKRLMSFVH